MARGLWAPPALALLAHGVFRQTIFDAIRFIRFQEYFLNRFSETKTAENRELALWHLVNRLVPENV